VDLAELSRVMETDQPIKDQIRVSVCLRAPEGQRVHSIIKCVISPDKMTSTPSEIISSSVNNLTVWYDECVPVSDSLHLFGTPCLCRINHNYHYHSITTQAFRSYFFLPDCDVC
jgi:hypothetical protein